MSENELDGVRIRRLATERKAAIRARSYCLMGFAVCIVLEWGLCGMVVRQVMIGFHPRIFVCGIAAGIVAIPGALFGHRAIELSREIKKSALCDPASPPDFSTLSDGSQQSKNLEEIHD